MKKYFGLLLSTILLLSTATFATYDDFSKQLETIGVNVKKIESQNSISRYEVARLLNSVECKDCIIPPQTMIQKYVESFRSAFIQQEDKDFSDISYLGGIYNNQSYYYCIAYVGDNTYMKGYPKATSPICEGQFCGSKNMTTAEFIQVTINIIAKYIYKDININRKKAEERLRTITPGSYQDKVLHTQDKITIQENSKTCENICKLQHKDEISTYLKYCMFNLKACNMQEVGKIKQGYRPIAEINFLDKQNIINIKENTWKSTEKNIDGKTVLETLYKVYTTVSCDFDNDYDCDGIPNQEDNCPNTYNLQQKDRDKDDIGDVCDDDIDGDGIKNPIGIVDDNGNIAISKWTKDMDNCLFIVNTDQQDSNKNNIGDVCTETQEYIGMYIDIDTLKGIAPLTATFKAITAGENINTIVWNFGDGYQKEGNPVTHTFLSPGAYTIEAHAQSIYQEAKAYIRIIVGGHKGNINTIQARTNHIGDKQYKEITLSPLAIGTFDQIERSFPKENTIIVKNTQETVKKNFTVPGEHPVIIKGYNDGAISAISYFTIGIGENARGAILKSNISHTEIGENILFDTTTYRINQDDIVMVDRDFGDATKKTNNSLTVEHAYLLPGKKIVSQTIHLNDGKKLQNIITLYISDPEQTLSYSIRMIPSKLIANIGDKIEFQYQTIGTIPKNYESHITDFGDGKYAKSTTIQNTSHTYQKNGIQETRTKTDINQCTYIMNQVSIGIQGKDKCLDAITQGTLGQFRCDLDGDGIPDICDDDIDGDGIPNLLGLIEFENQDCSIIIDYTNPNMNINLSVLQNHYQNICSLDNAPFNINPDQYDLNMDGIGDAQKETPLFGQETIDSDGDGIVDRDDLCPTIKGIESENGCPKIGKELLCNEISIDQMSINTIECNQCPCPFSDIASDLTNNDNVRAILRNKEKTIPYRFSLPWIVNL